MMENFFFVLNKYMYYWKSVLVIKYYLLFLKILFFNYNLEFLNDWVILIYEKKI